MGADCKSAGFAYVGSNPTRPKHKNIPRLKTKFKYAERKALVA
jgi:hypothetical protein